MSEIQTRDNIESMMSRVYRIKNFKLGEVMLCGVFFKDFYT